MLRGLAGLAVHFAISQCRTRPAESRHRGIKERPKICWFRVNTSRRRHQSSSMDLRMRAREKAIGSRRAEYRESWDSPGIGKASDPIKQRERRFLRIGDDARHSRESRSVAIADRRRSTKVEKDREGRFGGPCESRDPPSALKGRVRRFLIRRDRRASSCRLYL